MRSMPGLAATLLFTGLAAAAEPAKVSVYPTPPVVVGTLVAPDATPTVLAGTFVPLRTDDPKPMPPAKGADAAPAPVPPTVSISACGACDATPCGTPLFRGRLFAASCGADVCESPGRPALFGGLFCQSPCSACESSGPCCPRARAFLARFKEWLTFRPCDGPRVGPFRFEPFMPRTMTVFPNRGCDAGTCHAAGACVGTPGCVGWGLGSGRGAARAAGTCAADGCRGGMPTGPLEALTWGRHRPPMNCADCEPKLSGAKFDECYHFANAIPKSYGCRTTRINPIGGCVTPPCDGTAKADPKGPNAPAAEPTKVERAAATLPAPHPLPASRSVKAATTPASPTTDGKSANPLKAPFSNP